MVRFYSGLVLSLLIGFIPLFAADTELKAGDTSKVATIIDSNKVKVTPVLVETVNTVQVQAPVAVVVITSEPAGAALLMNDSVAGTTPITLSGILPGNYTLTLKMKGYYQKKAEIAVSGKDTQKVHFDLLKPASVLFTSTPAGAQISLNGTIKGVTPLFDKAVKPGVYKVSATLSNYITLDTTISFGNGVSDTLAFGLSKAGTGSKNTGTTPVNGEQGAGTKAATPMSALRKYSGIIGAVAFGIFAIALLIGERNDL